MIHRFKNARALALVGLSVAACSTDSTLHNGADAAATGGASGHGDVDAGTGGKGAGTGGSGGSNSQDAATSGHDGGRADAGEGADGAAPSDAGAAGLAEQVLADPNVQAALTAASDAGHPLFIHTEHSPPKISGYYLKPDHEGSFVATDNGDGVGYGVMGMEVRIDVDPADLVTLASVSFLDGIISSGSVETGVVLRGTSDEFTLYTTYHANCPEAGSDFAVDGYSITTARLSSDAGFEGYWLYVRRLIVTTKTSGTLTDGCATIFVGGSEIVGGWSLSEVPRYQKITPADLLYMCVDNGAGYVEGETWTRGSAQVCECTPSYAVSCM